VQFAYHRGCDFGYLCPSIPQEELGRRSGAEDLQGTNCKHLSIENSEYNGTSKTIKQGKLLKTEKNLKKPDILFWARENT